MQLDLGRFRDTFFEEAAELLEELEAGLLHLDRHPKEDSDTLNAVFRAAHSIKGSAGMLDMHLLMRFTHGMESLLDAMRGGDVPADSQRLELLLRAADLLGELLQLEKRGGGPEPAGMTSLERELESALGAGLARSSPPDTGAAATEIAEQDGATPLGAAPKAGTLWRIEVRPGAQVMRRGVEPLLLLRELDRLGRILASRPQLDRLPALSALDPLETYLTWVVELECRQGGAGEIEELLDWFGAEGKVEQLPAARSTGPSPSAPALAPSLPQAGLPDGAARPPAAPALAASSTVRVAVDKIDQLVTLAGELAVAHSMASEVAGNFRSDRWPELEMALADIGRQVWLLQQSVMSVRMLPASDLFGRLPRLVRELESQTGKRLELILDGEDAEIDKSVAERLADPLTHLVRNAADHGIEPAAERVAAGKPEAGAISVRAMHEAGDVVVEITDDGRGLNAARIREKAVERGLISPSTQMDDQALFGLIFEPGFSTAEKVTSLSGRGVGMDVVRKNIEALGGAVSLNSRPGRGTQIRIRLPLTLAILDGLLVSVAGGLYLIPMTAIVKSIEPGEVSAVPGQSGVMLVDGEPMMIGLAADLLGITQNTRAERPLAVILAKDRRRCAVVVDELLGRQQVIVRNLEDHYRKVPGLLGASILGDGQVVLILDPGWLLEQARGEGARAGGGNQ